VIIRRRLLTPEDDQRIGIDCCRQRLSRPGPVDVDQGRCFMQCDADLAVMGDVSVLDNGDAHGPGLLLGGRNSKARAGASGAFALAKPSRA
jgi:hypothetical protein